MIPVSHAGGGPVLRLLPALACLCALFAAGPAQASRPGAERPAGAGPAHVTELRDASPEALVFTGAVLIGVDVFGRVLAAVDEEGDGHGDRFYLFRTQGRYEGPWSRLLAHATLIETDGGLAIYTDDHRFGVTLNLETGAAPLPPGTYREAHNYGDGIELSVATPEDGYPAMPLSTLRFDDPSTWPEPLRPDQGPRAAVRP